jgi:tetratricopeptide (TPR) repeat protein
MSKCSKCGKETKKLSSYGDLLLCKDCAATYDDEIWLIRTTDGRILGPYPGVVLKELISDKKIVFLDEVSRPGDDWALLKNVDEFRDVALKTTYDLSDATMDIEITKPPVFIEEKKQRRPSSTPPSFKTKKEKTRREADFVDTKFIPKGVLIHSGPKSDEGIIVWWKNKRFVFITAGVVLVILWSSSLYFFRGSDEDTRISSSNMTAGSEAFNKYYIEGREFEDGGLFNDAIKDYAKALDIRPEHFGARIRKAGIELSALDNKDRAQNELEELYSQVNIGKITDPEEQTDIRTFLGILEYKKANMQSAIGYFNQALATRPTNPFIYYNMAMVFIKQDNYPAAVEYLKNAQKLLPAFSDAVVLEGLCLMKLGRFREAYKVFSEAVVQNPNIREFYTLGAYAAYRSIGIDKAYDILRRISNLDPYYHQRVFSPLAQIKRKANIVEEISYVEEIVKSFSEDKKQQGLYMLAFLHLSEGNYTASNQILSSMEHEGSSLGQLILAIIAYGQNNMREAEKRVYKSLELDYSNNIAHIYAGQIALRRDDFGQAKNHFTKAQASDDATSLYAITLLGDINVRVGEMNQAMMLWKKVLSFDSRYIPAWERILKVGRKS